MSEGWEGMQRQGQDMADRFRHGLSCMLHNSSWSFNSPRLLQEEAEEDRDEEEEEGGFAPWLWPQKPCPPTPRNKPSRVQLRRSSGSGKRRKPCVDFDFDLDRNGSLPPGWSASAIGGICDLGQRLGQAGADLVQHLVQSIPLPFHTIGARRSSPEENLSLVRVDGWSEAEEMGIPERNRVGIGWKSYMSGGAASFPQPPTPQNESDTHEEDSSPPTANEDIFPFPLKPPWHFHNQGSISVSTNYDSRTQEVESSVVARGDLWRAEASHGGNTSTNGASPLFLFQIGPILFVRDTTLLLPVHLSKQHLLWYGFDRKNGLHSLCPAVWSKHRRWLFMSMICLNPLTCSFIDLQFPNGQFTYVAGEGLTSSAFFPVLGGLLQAQSRHPGNTKFSFSRKAKWGMRLTPALQLSDKSFSLGVMQPLAWQRSGLIVRPSVQVSVTPTFGGRNSGWRAELIHSPKEKLSWSCGCSMSIQPSAFASVSIGRSKKYGQSGSLGLVLQVETPLENLSRASFSVQLNSGVEF